MNVKELHAAIAEGRAVDIPPLATALGVSLVSLYAAVRRGEVPATKIGKRRVIPASTAKKLLGIDQEVA